MSFFYDLNKKLDSIRATPEVTHKQLNERDMGKHNNGKTTGFKAVADKAAKEYGSKAAGERVAGAQFQKMKKAGQLEEGPLDAVKQIGKKVAGGINKLVGHGSDEDMIRDLQRKSGAPVTGKKPAAVPKQTPIDPKDEYDYFTGRDKVRGGEQQVKEKLSPAKQKSFAALAPPEHKITFADKIAGAKKEVDEMLGDVAAEAMRSALGGGKGRNAGMEEGSEENAFTAHKRPAVVQPKVGSTERGHKHDIKHTATGRMVTRRVDDQGNSVGADDDSAASGEKRGRGRPKGTKQSIGAKGPSGRSKLMTKESDVDVTDQGEYDQEGDMAKNDIKTIVRHAQALSKVLGDNDNLPEWVQSKLAKIEGMMISVDEYMQNQAGDEEAIAEEPKSKNQAVAARIARGVQKGTAKAKPGSASAEMAKMQPKELNKFAKGSTKGLPDKVKSKKKEEEVDESTTSGSVATSTATTGSKGGVFGKGIYDSMNRELEKMISESMSINMSDSTEGNKSLTVTATDDDAMKLAMILKSAGLGGGDTHGDHMHSHGEEACDTCGMQDCGCGDVQEAVDENAPDWPTNTEQADSNFGYSGGLDGPKTDVAGAGQTTVPNTNVHTQEEDALRRMMEMAGIKQAELEPWKETMKEEGVAEEWAPMKTSAVGKKDSLIAGDFDKWLTNASDRDIMDYVHDEEGGGMPTHHTTTRWQELKKRQTDLLGGPAAAREKGINDRLKSTLIKKYPNITAPMKEEEEVEEDFLESIQRMREIAGIREAKKDLADKDYDGDGELETGAEEHAGSVDKAIKKSQEEKKVDESIFALTNQWKAYKG
jgi:hypothetical protein